MGKMNKQDWHNQLAQLSQQMKESMTKEEKAQMRKEEEEKRWKRSEINRRKKQLYQFLVGYKQNSGILVNNFFRNRDYQTYCMDKFHSFDFDFHGGIFPNVFDDFAFSMAMVGYLRELEEAHIAYHPITKEYMEQLINFAKVLELSEPLEYDTVFYRGCSTIERNGVNGIVSVTSDYKIAEQFSRGTILTIHVPAGTQNLNINGIRPREQRNKDFEQEFLLPPCEYEIISSKEVKSGREPNNHTGRTKLLEVKVKPLDLLEEFLKAMENPPEEYMPIMSAQGGDYEEVVSLLKDYIQCKNRQGNKTYSKYKKQTNIIYGHYFKRSNPLFCFIFFHPFSSIPLLLKNIMYIKRKKRKNIK